MTLIQHNSTYIWPIIFLLFVGLSVATSVALDQESEAGAITVGRSAGTSHEMFDVNCIQVLIQHKAVGNNRFENTEYMRDYCSVNCNTMQYNLFYSTVKTLTIIMHFIIYSSMISFHLSIEKDYMVHGNTKNNPKIVYSYILLLQY